MSHPDGRRPADEAGLQGQTEQQSSVIVSATADECKPAELTRHPLSAAFGDMPADEFAELVADIKKHGQISDIIKSADGSILDGWHRYRACLQAGVKPRIEPFNYVIEAAAEQAGKPMTEAEFVVAQNAHRRHLTQEQRRRVVAELLKADPAMSNRAIGKAAKVDDKTVGVVRAKLEATAEIPQLTKTTGRDGKARPVKTKPPRATERHPLLRGSHHPQPTKQLHKAMNAFHGLCIGLERINASQVEPDAANEWPEVAQSVRHAVDDLAQRLNLAPKVAAKPPKGTAIPERGLARRNPALPSPTLPGSSRVTQLDNEAWRVVTWLDTLRAEDLTDPALIVALLQAQIDDLKATLASEVQA